MARAQDKRPWRKVREYSDTKGIHEYRIVVLECGHCLIKQPAQRVPKRARCHKCEEVE